MRDQRDGARGLLLKASNDLFAAKTVIATGQALDTVAFHAQQATEKSLKALLILLGIEYPLTHDVVALMDLAVEHYAPLSAYEAEMDKFALYGVVVRYDQMICPSLAEARELLAVAQQVFDYASAVTEQGQEP